MKNVFIKPLYVIDSQYFFIFPSYNSVCGLACNLQPSFGLRHRTSSPSRPRHRCIYIPRHHISAHDLTSPPLPQTLSVGQIAHHVSCKHNSFQYKMVLNLTFWKSCSTSKHRQDFATRNNHQSKKCDIFLLNKSSQ